MDDGAFPLQSASGPLTTFLLYVSRHRVDDLPFKDSGT